MKKEMKEYIGVKIVEAAPQSKIIRVKESTDEEPGVYTEMEGYKVVYKGGYVSWSPKDVFEESYKLIDDMRQTKGGIGDEG